MLLVVIAQIGGVFPQIGTTQSSTVRRQPVLFFVVINQVSQSVSADHRPANNSCYEK
jgi:hypothetical protein